MSADVWIQVQHCWPGFTLRSACSEVLFRELESRQTALRHFIQYLSETGQQKVLLQLLGSVLVPPEPASPAHSVISPFFFCSSSELWDAQRRQRYVAPGNPAFCVRVEMTFPVCSRGDSCYSIKST